MTGHELLAALQAMPSSALDLEIAWSDGEMGDPGGYADWVGPVDYYGDKLLLLWYGNPTEGTWPRVKPIVEVVEADD